MALPIWPTSLPDIRGENSSFQAPMHTDAVSVTQFDDGPDVQRNRQLYDVTPLSIVLTLEPAGLVIFKAFVKADLNRGAARFRAPVALADFTVGQRTCWIKGGYVARPFGLQWQATFTLCVMDW